MDGHVVVIAALLAAGALAVLRLSAPRGSHAVRTIACRAVSGDEGAETVRTLAKTVEYRSALAPEAALEAVMRRFGDRRSLIVVAPAVHLTERSADCLHYAVSTKSTMFLEAAVSSVPLGSGSTMTLEILRCLESVRVPTAKKNLAWLRKEIEAALRASGAEPEIWIRSNSQNP